MIGVIKGHTRSLDYSSYGHRSIFHCLGIPAAPETQCHIAAVPHKSLHDVQVIIPWHGLRVHG